MIHSDVRKQERSDVLSITISNSRGLSTYQHNQSNQFHAPGHHTGLFFSRVDVETYFREEYFCLNQMRTQSGLKKCSWEMNNEHPRDALYNLSCQPGMHNWMWGWVAKIRRCFFAEILTLQLQTGSLYCLARYVRQTDYNIERRNRYQRGWNVFHTVLFGIHETQNYGISIGIGWIYRLALFGIRCKRAELAQCGISFVSGLVRVSMWSCTVSILTWAEAIRTSCKHASVTQFGISWMFWDSGKQQFES